MPKWNIDPDHSVASFSIGHMTVAYVHGQMNSVSGTINYDPGDIQSLSVDIRVGPESIITGVQKRDDHLKSGDFFDIGKFPDITFRSSSIEPSGNGRVKVSGELSIHGIVKPLTLEVSVSGPVKSPFGETTLGITGDTVIDRGEFGIDWNQPMEGGGLMVGMKAEVSVSLEADLEE